MAFEEVEIAPSLFPPTTPPAVRLSHDYEEYSHQMDADTSIELFTSPDNSLEVTKKDEREEFSPTYEDLADDISGDDNDDPGSKDEQIESDSDILGIFPPPRRHMEDNTTTSNVEVNPQRFYEDSGHMTGFIYTPKQVRKLLRATKFFDDNQLRCWREYLIAPPGINHQAYIMVRAARVGLDVRAIYDGTTLNPAPENLSRAEIQKANCNNGLDAGVITTFSRY
jgi:hypothetical protein